MGAILITGPNEREDEDYYKDLHENDTLWIKDKNVFSSTSKIKLTDKLDPGVYVAGVDPSAGFYATKITTKSDELYRFKQAEEMLKIQDEIATFWTKAPLYKEANILHKRGILLYGTPGTGKTSLITLLCEDLLERKGIIFKVNSPEELSIHIRFLKDNFRVVEKETPVITILEDIDKYGNYETELLDFLDGSSQIDHHVFLATSNNTSNIPGTLLRPSRIDLKVKMPIPNEQTKKDYLMYKGFDESEIEAIIGQSDKFSMADLKELFICVKLLGLSLEDSVDKVKDKIDKRDFTDCDITEKGFGI